jgi:hypothetical protein
VFLLRMVAARNVSNLRGAVSPASAMIAGTTMVADARTVRRPLRVMSLFAVDCSEWSKSASAVMLSPPTPEGGAGQSEARNRGGKDRPELKTAMPDPTLFRATLE